jgi:hypothetical protein
VRSVFGWNIVKIFTGHSLHKAGCHGEYFIIKST